MKDNQMENQKENKEVKNKTSKEKIKLMPVLKRMMQVLAKRDKKTIGLIAIYTLAAAIYPFFAVFLPKIAIGALEQGGANAGTTLLLAMLAYTLTAGPVGWVMVYLQSVIDARLLHLRMNYLEDQIEKLLRMDYKHVEDAHFYEEYEKAMNSCNNNNDGVEGIYRRMYKLPAQALTIIGMFLLVGYLHPVILICLCLHVAVTMWVGKLNYKNEYNCKEETSAANRKINYFHNTTHDFSYGKDIRIYHLKNRIMANYDAEIGALKKILQKLRSREYLLSFLCLGTLLITNVVMYGILISQAYGGMAISSFSMYVSAITSLMASLLLLGDNISMIANQGQYVADYFRLIDSNLTTGEGTTKKPEGTLEIVFDHVTFRYPGSDVNVFEDLNFTIHKGERLAIVGVNGAGKSTLVKLMTGLYEPTEGQIFINGTEIRQYGKEELYSMFSAVFQEVNVLAFDIRENVACKLEDVDDFRVKEALEKVGLWDKVAGFEKGLDQMMLKVIDEEGTDFSGGERQKLAIARGLYKNANMVIMDEPTAALDALAEAEIYENFSTLVEGKTAVYISHRLASTKFCDKIALFDKDGLKEYGSHEELMAKKGHYYEMFTIQGKYYQENPEDVA